MTTPSPSERPEKSDGHVRPLTPRTARAWLVLVYFSLLWWALVNKPVLLIVLNAQRIWPPFLGIPLAFAYVVLVSVFTVGLSLYILRTSGPE